MFVRISLALVGLLLVAGCGNQGKSKAAAGKGATPGAESARDQAIRKYMADERAANEKREKALYDKRDAPKRKLQAETEEKNRKTKEPLVIASVAELKKLEADPKPYVHRKVQVGYDGRHLVYLDPSDVSEENHEVKGCLLYFLFGSEAKGSKVFGVTLLRYSEINFVLPSERGLEIKNTWERRDRKNSYPVRFEGVVEKTLSNRGEYNEREVYVLRVTSIDAMGPPVELENKWKVKPSEMKPVAMKPNENKPNENKSSELKPSEMKTGTAKKSDEPSPKPAAPK
jgi:hypothetical protein